jgi:multidrug efflux pump subunit AcrA (membrane-fusion protein)
MQRKHFVLIGVAVLIIAGSALAFRHLWPARDAEAADSPSPPAPIVAGTVAQHDVPIYLSGVGTVIAYNTVVVRAQIQGQITSINFTEGQQVHAGDLLAQIDPRPYQAQMSSSPPIAIATRPSSTTPMPISTATPRWSRRASPHRNFSTRRRRKWRNSKA